MSDAKVSPCGCSCGGDYGGCSLAAIVVVMGENHFMGFYGNKDIFLFFFSPIFTY